MKKTLKILLGAALICAMSVIPVFAGTGVWKSDGYGYWWQRTDGSYPVNEWKWIDGNGDGVAECYHFDKAGYMDANTWIGGDYVDRDGAWTTGTVKHTRTDAFDEVYGAGTQTPANPAVSMPALDRALEGNYEMHTELVDSLIHIENGRDGMPHLYFQMYGVHEDGSSAEQLYDFYLQDVGAGQSNTLHHYVGDDVTHSGDMITFEWMPGMNELQHVVLNGEYLTSYSRKTY